MTPLVQEPHLISTPHTSLYYLLTEDSRIAIGGLIDIYLSVSQRP